MPVTLNIKEALFGAVAVIAIALAIVVPIFSFAAIVPDIQASDGIEIDSSSMSLKPSGSWVVSVNAVDDIPSSIESELPKSDVVVGKYVLQVACTESNETKIVTSGFGTIGIGISVPNGCKGAYACYVQSNGSVSQSEVAEPKDGKVQFQFTDYGFSGGVKANIVVAMDADSSSLHTEKSKYASQLDDYLKSADKTNLSNDDLELVELLKDYGKRNIDSAEDSQAAFDSMQDAKDAIRLVLEAAANSKSQPTSGGSQSSNGEASGSSGTVAVSKVTLSTKSSILGVGKSMTATSKVEPSNATQKTLTFSSSDTNIAKVSSKGVIKGISVGKAKIKAATANGKSASVTITVVPASALSTSGSGSGSAEGAESSGASAIYNGDSSGAVNSASASLSSGGSAASRFVEMALRGSRTSRALTDDSDEAASESDSVEYIPSTPLSDGSDEAFGQGQMIADEGQAGSGEADSPEAFDENSNDSSLWEENPAAFWACVIAALLALVAAAIIYSNLRRKRRLESMKSAAANFAVSIEAPKKDIEYKMGMLSNLPAIN